MVRPHDDLPYPVPIVSAIVEREHGGEVQVLLQVRWKPETDPAYSGTWEIPAGAIEKGERVYDALRREVYEETGLTVTRIVPDVRTAVYARGEDAAYAFLPFCCQQQTRGLQRVGVVFLCQVEDAPPAPNPAEVREVRWVSRAELEHMLEDEPEAFFTFQLGTLNYYIDFYAETR
jgi:8-oxo-dGTP pyrophosphatase MutT (NUDIX family)